MKKKGSPIYGTASDAAKSTESKSDLFNRKFDNLFFIIPKCS